MRTIDSDASNALNAMGYDAIAEEWTSSRPRISIVEASLFGRACSRASPGGAYLDLGCGSGEPFFDIAVKKRLVVTGVDQSEMMIALARRTRPKATWIRARMEDYLPCSPQHVIIAWDCMFHVPRDLHQTIFRKVRASLFSKGAFLFTYGAATSDPFLQKVNGHPLYFDCLPINELPQALASAGFEVECQTVLDPPVGADKGRVAVLAVAS